MKVVVLGSTGYLGNRMIRRLADDGHEILCVVRRPMENDYWGEGKISWCLSDDLGERLSSSQPYDFALNFACKYSRGGNRDEDVYEANLYSPLKYFTICARYGVKNLLTVDTGLPHTLNVYAMSKHLLSEALRWECSRDSSLNVLNIRLENFYGEDEPKDRFLHHVINKLKAGEDVPLTEGRQVRDFIYIGDVIDNLTRLLSKGLKGYHDIPLGTGEGVSIRELVTFLKNTTGSESRLLFGIVEMRTGEPDSVADRDTMDIYGITIRFDWRTGMRMLAGV